jgi:uncharacterized protein (DUF1778 family)
MPRQPKPKPNKAGRPPLPNGSAKAEMLRIRVTPDERKAIDAAAKAKSQSRSDWIRSTLTAAIGG